MSSLCRYAVAVALTLLGVDLAHAQYGSPYGSSYPSGSRIPGAQFGRPGRPTAFDYTRPSGIYGTSQFGSPDLFAQLGGGSLTGRGRTERGATPGRPLWRCWDRWRSSLERWSETRETASTRCSSSRPATRYSV